MSFMILFLAQVTVQHHHWWYASCNQTAQPILDYFSHFSTSNFYFFIIVTILYLSIPCVYTWWGILLFSWIIFWVLADNPYPCKSQTNMQNSIEKNSAYHSLHLKVWKLPAFKMFGRHKSLPQTCRFLHFGLPVRSLLSILYSNF